jgi:glycosyltransferase involved in cell wall biosynthesis
VGDDGLKVSVIIPTYNRRDYLTEAIQSILSQTLANVEIIVVDDGSDDNTGEWLRTRFGNAVRYFYQDNRGRAAARNWGIKLARARYLLFLDSDDLLLPDALANQSSLLDAHPDLDVVYSDGYYCDAAGRNLERISLGRPTVDRENPMETMLLTNVIVAIHSAMVRRTALERLGYPYFDESLHGGEDADMWLRLAANKARFAYVALLTCKYRLHETNTSIHGSPDWQQFWQSLVRSQYKHLGAAFFTALSSTTRQRFFYKLLLVYLKDDTKAQEIILRSSQFRALPRTGRARLFYDVGLDNIMQCRLLAYGKARLQRAVDLAPWQLQYRLIWYLSLAGESTLRSIVSLRRKLGRLRRRGEVDYSSAPHWRPGWRR